MGKTGKIIGNISALIGIIGFMWPLLDIETVNFTILQWIFISASILILIGYIIYESFSGPKKYKNQEDIKKYMRNWIGQNGRIVILTRDMSWADDLVTKNGLREKARRNELTICQPTKTNFSTELEQLGAEIYDYSNLGFVPQSRFTFIRYNTVSSKVAIGKTDTNHIHYIKEHSHGEMEYFLAEDLVNLIKALP